jgi:phytoene desaturase
MDGSAAFPPADNRPRAVVIGAGFGGLAAAIRLGAKGYDVTLAEKLDGPGGRAYTFRQDGFTFDAGPTILTAPHLFEELWALCGRRLADDITLRPLDPFYTLRFDDGTLFHAHADEHRMREQIAAMAPGDVPGYEAFLKASERIFEAAYTRLAHEPFHRFTRLLQAAPELIRLRGYTSVHATVSRYFKDERLRIAHSFHPLFVGGSPYAAPAYYALISHLERLWGVHYAIGGTGALARGLASLIEGQGSTIRYGAEVDEILTRDGRATGVKLLDGEVIPADLVISNGEVGWTYRHLLRATPRRFASDRRLSRARHSMSLFVWYFGTRRQYPDVPHHTILLGPRYKGLIDDIFRRKIIAEDMSLYLHRPTASDATLAPPGCDTFYVLAPVPHLGGGADWEAMAAPFRQRVAKRLEETVLPGLRDEIVSERLMTPIDFRDRLRSTHGAAFGFAPELLQSAWFRPHNQSPDIKGLYLVGAGTHPGAGVPSVLCSAKVVDTLLPEAAHWPVRTGA